MKFDMNTVDTPSNITISTPTLSQYQHIAILTVYYSMQTQHMQ
jgi:hypothetical protein